MHIYRMEEIFTYDSWTFYSEINRYIQMEKRVYHREIIYYFNYLLFMALQLVYIHLKKQIMAKIILPMLLHG